MYRPSGDMAAPKAFPLDVMRVNLDLEKGIGCSLSSNIRKSQRLEEQRYIVMPAMIMDDAFAIVVLVVACSG